MSQEREIRKYLMSGRKLTSLEALFRFGCFRLASRISDLIKKGISIDKKMVEINGKYVAQYYIKNY